MNRLAANRIVMENPDVACYCESFARVRLAAFATAIHWWRNGDDAAYETIDLESRQPSNPHLHAIVTKWSGPQRCVGEAGAVCDWGGWWSVRASTAHPNMTSPVN